MTDKVDEHGHFILDRHALVTLALAGVSAIDCEDFDRVPGIILDLEITRAEEQFRLE